MQNSFVRPAFWLVVELSDGAGEESRPPEPLLGGSTGRAGAVLLYIHLQLHAACYSAVLAAIAAKRPASSSESAAQSSFVGCDGDGERGRFRSLRVPATCVRGNSTVNDACTPPLLVTGILSLREDVFAISFNSRQHVRLPHLQRHLGGECLRDRTEDLGGRM